MKSRCLDFLDLLNIPGTCTRFGEGSHDRRQWDTTIELAWINTVAAQDDLFHKSLVNLGASLASD